MGKCNRLNSKTCRLSLMLLLTGGYFVVEIVVGHLTHSMALVADSYHMLSDVLSLIVGIVCVRVSKRSANARNTFGWGRAEVLGALVNAVFLLALCFSILIEAIHRYTIPEAVKEPREILIVGAVGLAVNLAGLALFSGSASMHGHSHGGGFHGHSHGNSHGHSHGHGHSHSHGHGHSHGGHLKNGGPLPKKDEVVKTPPKVPDGHLNMHSVFLHVLGDALGSLIVVVNAIIVWQVPNDNVAKYLDPSLSLILVAIMVISTIPLLRASALVLMQAVPFTIDIEELERQIIEKIPAVCEVHDLHVWAIASNKNVASVHIVVDDTIDFKELSKETVEIFRAVGISSTTIQMEKSSDHDDDEEECLPEGVEVHFRSRCNTASREDGEKMHGRARKPVLRHEVLKGRMGRRRSMSMSDLNKVKLVALTPPNDPNRQSAEKKTFGKNFEDV